MATAFAISVAVAAAVGLLTLALVGMTSQSPGIDVPAQRAGAAPKAEGQPPFPPLTPIAAVATQDPSMQDRSLMGVRPCCVQPAAGVEGLGPLLAPPPVIQAS